MFLDVAEVFMLKSENIDDNRLFRGTATACTWDTIDCCFFHTSIMTE